MIQSMKTVLKLVLIINLFVLAACKNQGPSANNSEVKPPVTDIQTAAFLGDIKSINQHIMAGTDLNVKDEYGSCPLMIAITFNKTDVAESLIKAGANLNLTNNQGATPLNTAAFLCRKEIVALLLEQGADKSIPDNYGSTPLQSVSAPFEAVKPIYDELNKSLGSLGFKLDYEYIQATRPLIADMLK